MTASTVGPAHPRRAFSLLEVMVAATLLITGISGIVVAVKTALELQEHQRKVGQALIIGERRLEELLLLFPGSQDLADGRHPADGFFTFDAAGRPGGDDFRVFYVARPDPAVQKSVILDLTVSWDERAGERSLTLSTVR